MRHIAITGASGQLGSLIARRLLDKPDVAKVIALDVNPPCLASDKLDYRNVDIRDTNLVHHFAGCDAVVHCAFMVATNAPDDVYRSVNIDGSKHVFRAARDAGVEHVVYLSSVLAYGAVPGHPIPIREYTQRRYQPAFPYSACKFEVEAFLDDFEFAHPEMIVCRLRPNILLGRNVPHALGWLMRRGFTPHHNGATIPLSWDEDVADLAVMALAQRAGGAFNAAVDDPVTANDLEREFGMKILSPSSRVVAVLDRIDRAMKRRGYNLPYDMSWVTQFPNSPLMMSSERAHTRLGWQPREANARLVVARFLATAPKRMDWRLRAAFTLLGWEGRQPRIAPPPPSRVHLCLTGPAGGDVTLLTGGGRAVIVPGPAPLPTSAITLPAPALIDMLRGKPAQGLRIDGRGEGLLALNWLIAGFNDLQLQSGLRGIGARWLRPRLDSPAVSADAKA